MTSAAQEVAALEAETAEAVSAAQAAQEAAASAVASAAVIENQVIVEAAEHAAELEQTVAENKDDISWLRERMTALETAQTRTLEVLDAMSVTLLALTAEPEPQSTASPSPTSQEPPPSNEGVADLREAENPASKEAEKPSPKQKRHRLV